MPSTRWKRVHIKNIAAERPILAWQTVAVLRQFKCLSFHSRGNHPFDL